MRLTEQLRRCQEHVIPLMALEGLAGLAAIACAGRSAPRAQPLGAATAHGAIDDADVTAQLERQFVGLIRAAFGQRRWHKAEAEGSRLNLQQAIALALTPDRRSAEVGRASTPSPLRRPRTALPHPA
jgi:hypothetical protein